MKIRDFQNVLKKFRFRKVREEKHSIWRCEEKTIGTILVPIQHWSGFRNRGIIGRYVRRVQINPFKLKDGAECRYSGQDYENDYKKLMRHDLEADND